MYITYELLKEKGACSDGLNWFKQNFPEGCELNEETIARVEKCDTRFVWWFYNNIQQDKRLYKLCGVNGSGGVSWSNGVNGSFGILNSYGVDRALFLANKKRVYLIFGKEVSEGRFLEIENNLYRKLGSWKPTFNNIKALYLKNGSDWKLTPIKNAEEISKQEAWKDMPRKAVEYVASLPEFDADMFFEITCIDLG